MQWKLWLLLVLNTLQLATDWPSFNKPKISCIHVERVFVSVVAGAEMGEHDLHHH